MAAFAESKRHPAGSGVEFAARRQHEGDSLGERCRFVALAGPTAAFPGGDEIAVQREETGGLGLPIPAQPRRIQAPCAEGGRRRGIEVEDGPQGGPDGRRVGRVAQGTERTIRVIGDDPAPFREVGRHDRNPGGKAFVQLVRCGDPLVGGPRLIRHRSNVRRGDPFRQVGRRDRRNQVDTGGQLGAGRQSRQSIA